MIENMAGPNQYIDFLVLYSTNSLTYSFKIRKGYRRGYQEFGRGAKLYPERYNHGKVHILSKEEIEVIL